MKKLILSVSLIYFMQVNKSFSQFATPPTLNAGTQVTGGDVGIGTASPASKLDVLNAGNQLRLSYSGSIFSDIQTTSSGYLFLNPSNGPAGRIGIGTSSPLTGFHSNMGIFRITDPGSTSRGFQVSPNYTTANGDLPPGTVVLTPITASGEGLSFASSGSGAAGVKIGTYAYSQSLGWKSMCETENVGFATPILSLVKNGGNIGIGAGTTAPQSHVDIANGSLGQTAGNKVEWERMYASSGINQDNLRIYHKRYAAGNNWNSAEIRIQKTVDVTDQHYISFRGDAGGASSLNFGHGNTDYMSISDAGRVSIGTLKQLSGPHTDSKLSIDGKTVTKSLYVTLTGWADYVFAADYKLPNLYDIEKFYLENKHLPEVPSEKEIAETGIDVAQMNVLLLKKIEEMTIIMVKQQKDIDELKTKIK